MDAMEDAASEGWIEASLARISAGKKKTYSITWSPLHDRMARDLETDLHFDHDLSKRVVNRSTLTALGVELVYERFYGRKPPGVSPGPSSD